VTILTSLVIGWVVGGWVLSLLWLWFVSPFNVAPIGIFHATGLSMLASAFLGQHTQIINQQAIRDHLGISQSYLLPIESFLVWIFILIGGWVIHLFV